MTVPWLIVRIEKLRRRLHDADDPGKRLKISQELDKLLNEYYKLRM